MTLLPYCSGAAAGVLNGLFGAGGGMILVPALTLILKEDEVKSILSKTAPSILTPEKSNSLKSIGFPSISLLNAFTSVINKQRILVQVNQRGWSSAHGDWAHGLEAKKLVGGNNTECYKRSRALRSQIESGEGGGRNVNALAGNGRDVVIGPG